MIDRLLTSGEVAELLSVPESWVRDQTRSGAIPHIELGRYKRYRQDEVLQWLDGLASGGGPRFRRYTPAKRQSGPGDAGTSRGLTPKE